MYYERGTRIELLDVEPGTLIPELEERFIKAGGLFITRSSLGPPPRVFNLS
jgi:hypothetical protein